MNTEKNGGNPLLDSKEAKERFNFVVRPTLENIGFIQSKGSSFVMTNPTTETILIPISAPSNFKIDKALVRQIRELRKEFKNPWIGVLFTRDFKEWKSKETYVSKLKKIMGMNLLNGVSVGLSSLPTIIPMIENKEFYRLSK